MSASNQIIPAGSINHVGVRYLSPQDGNNIEIYDSPDIGTTANLLMTINVTTGTVKFENDIYLNGLSTALGQSISFTPTVSASGSMTATSATGGSCKYWKIGDLRIISYYITDIVIGGTPSNEVRLSYPFTADGTSYGGGACVGNSSADVGFYLANTSTTVGFRKVGQANWSVGSGNDIIAIVVAMEA